MKIIHCVKRIQIRSFFWSVFSPNTGKYGPEKTPHLDTYYVVIENASVIVQVGKIIPIVVLNFGIVSKCKFIKSLSEYGWINGYFKKYNI